MVEEISYIGGSVGGWGGVEMRLATSGDFLMNRTFRYYLGI